MLLLLSAFTMMSCSNRALLNRKERRVVGVWEFDKASFKEDGDLFRDNITNEFDGDAIEFFPDGTAAYDDASLGTTLDGRWDLYIDRFSDRDESDVEFFLDMTFFDVINGGQFSYFTNAIRLRSKAHR